MMRIRTNRLKKLLSLSLVLFTAVSINCAMVMNAEASLSECTTNTNGRTGQTLNPPHNQPSTACTTNHCSRISFSVNLQGLKNRDSGNNCLNQLPMDMASGINLSATVGIRTDYKSTKDFGYGTGAGKDTGGISFSDGTRPHEGIDVGLGRPKGSYTTVKLYAPAEGRVSSTKGDRGQSCSQGMSHVYMKHTRGSSTKNGKACKEYETRFYHLTSIQVSTGQKIGKNSWIGYAGPCSGYNPHMHYEIRDCDGTLFNPLCSSGGAGDPQQLCNGVEQVLPATDNAPNNITPVAASTMTGCFKYYMPILTPPATTRLGGQSILPLLVEYLNNATGINEKDRIGKIKQLIEASGKTIDKMSNKELVNAWYAAYPKLWPAGNYTAETAKKAAQERAQVEASMAVLENAGCKNTLDIGCSGSINGFSSNVNAVATAKGMKVCGAFEEPTFQTSITNDSGTMGGGSSGSGYVNLESSSEALGSGMSHYESGYKCDLASYLRSYQGCIFCPLFKVLFNTASSLARKSHETFSSALFTLLGIGLAIWIAFTVLKAVSSFRGQEPKVLLNTIFQKVFIVALIMFCLKLNVTEFFNMFVAPLFDTGMEMARMFTQKTCSNSYGISADGGLPVSMGNSMICVIEVVQKNLLNLMALGSNSICVALYVKSFWGFPIFPHFGYLITGLFLWVIAIVFMLAYPFLLIDCVLQFSIASSLFPAGLAGSAFKITAKYLSIGKIVKTFLNAMFNFIFLTLTMFILLAGINSTIEPIMTQAFESSEGSGFFDLKTLAWYGVEFLKLLFYLFLGKAVLDDVPAFADKFSGGGINLAQDIGKPMGGLVNRAGTEMTKATGGLALGAAKGVVLDPAGRGAKKLWNKGVGAASSVRQNYLMNKIKDNNAASGALAQFESGAIDSLSHSGRTWYGRKVTRTLTRDGNGNLVMNSEKKKLLSLHNTVTKKDQTASIKKIYDKHGNVIGEDYKINAAAAKTLINKDGTRNDVAVNMLMQNTSLSKEEINKIIMNQMFKERMPNLSRSDTMRRKKVDMSKAFVNEQIRSYVDSNGHEVFEVRRIDKHGKTSVFRMTKGGKRDLLEYEEISASGKARKYASDGIIQMRKTYSYLKDSAGNFVQNENGMVIKDGSEKAMFTHAKGYTGPQLYDSNGNLKTATAQQQGVLFGTEDLQLYEKQMQNHGDVFKMWQFGK